MATNEKEISRDLDAAQKKLEIIQDVKPPEGALANWRQMTSRHKATPKSLTIANYSGALTCYEMLFNKSCVIDGGEKKVLLVQPFWLDNVHDSRLDSQWGQMVREFPPNIGKLFVQCFPDLGNKESADKRVTFRQVKEVREECLRLLEESGKYEIIRGECMDMELKHEKVEFLSREVQEMATKELGTHQMVIDTFLTPQKSIARPTPTKEKGEKEIEFIEISMKDEAKHRFEIDENVKVYNFSQKHLTADNLPSQTEVYTCPKGQEPPNLICLGSGLSAVWLKEQAGDNSKVQICVRNEKSALPPQLKRNDGKTLTMEDCTRIDLHDLRNVKAIMDSKALLDEPLKEKIVAYAKEHNISLNDITDNTRILVNKDSKEIVGMGEGVVAYGYTTDKDLTHKLPPEMLVLPDPLQTKRDFIAPKNIPGDAGFARFRFHKEQLLADKFQVEDVDIAALVFRETDKVLLAKEWGVGKDFMDHLGAEIKKLEDTPQDSKQFIKDTYQAWAVGKDQKEINANFNDAVDNLFDSCEQRSSKQL